MTLKVLITGCAGFIGSTLAEKLVERGYYVIGVDCFTNYYSPKLKRFNLSKLLANPHFQLIKLDLSKASLNQLIDITKQVEYIVHEAAQPSVRKSWGTNFKDYVRHNIIATQKLVEAASKADHVKRFIFASSSSVYGNVGNVQLREDIMPKPASPYGVTKLAGENLCLAYYENHGLPVVILRYFTVYGPKQRPDMAFHKFIRAMLRDEPIEIYGDGNQVRDFTYVDDVVEATVNALKADESVGEIINVGSSTPYKLMDAIKIIADIIGVEPKVILQKKEKGDVQSTYADVSKAKRLLNWEPSTCLDEGLANQILWMKQILKLNL